MTQGFDIDELERLLARATPGEWDWTDFPEITVDGVTAIIDCSAGDSEDENVANAQLIVAARNSLPAILTEIRELRAENARLREGMETIRARKWDTMKQGFDAASEAAKIARAALG